MEIQLSKLSASVDEGLHIVLDIFVLAIILFGKEVTRKRLHNMLCFENYDISLKNYSKREKGREDSWSVETHLNGTQRTSQTNIFLIA